MLLAPAIGRISKRAQKQRHVIMLGRIANREDHRDFSIESFDILTLEISFRIKHQPIDAAVQRKAGREQALNPSIYVGDAFANLLPAPVGHLKFEPGRHAVGGLAARRVQYVCGDGAHDVRSFSNLNLVIFRCSSAAIRSSVGLSLCRRWLRIASISGEDFPVAQTMKMKPKRCSYSRLPSASAVIVSVEAR
jgi:hypothetical protein